MNKIFTIAIATVLILTSCGRQDDPSISEQGEPMKITINLKNKISYMRSVDDQAIDEDAVINDMIVFVVRNDGNFDIDPVYLEGTQLEGGTSIPQITATTRATKVYIVCNTGPLETGPFRNALNLGNVERVALAVDSNPNTQSNCTSGNVWMAGNSPLETGGSVGGIATRIANVTLLFLPAKIYVIVNNEMTNYGPAGNTLLDGVAVINGGAWTDFVDAAGNFKPLRSDISTPGNVPFFYNGIPVNPALWVDQPAPLDGQADYEIRNVYNFSPPGIFPILTSPLVVTPQADQGFYVFPLITINKTYISIYGRFALDGANSPLATPFFWSLAFGGRDGLASDVTSGQKYVVTITLTGNAATGGGGTTDPTEEIIEAFVNISVVPAQWSPVLIEKIIQ